MKNLSSVYLLVLKDKPYFKIGKADNTVSRLEVLEKMWGKFDLVKSFEIKCSIQTVLKLEKTLQYIFEIHNIPMEEKYDGHTEWFSIDCLDSVITMAQSIKKEREDIIEIIHGVKMPIQEKKKSHISYKERRRINAKIREEKNIKIASEIIELVEQKKDLIDYISMELGLIKFIGLSDENYDFLFHKRFDSFTFFGSFSQKKEGKINIVWYHFDTKKVTYFDVAEKKLLLSIYQLLEELEQQPQINSDIEYGKNYLEKQEQYFIDFFFPKEKTIEEKVTFKIFKFNNLGIRKYKSLTLNINSIKMIHCGGCGCTIYYKNGRKKTILWLDYMILEEMKNDSSLDLSSYLWFEEGNGKEYQKFSSWKEQFPFDEIYRENPNLFD